MIKQYVTKKYVDAVQWTGENFDEIKIIDRDAEFLVCVDNKIDKTRIHSPGSSNYSVMTIGSYIFEDDRADIWIHGKDRFENEYKEVVND